MQEIQAYLSWPHLKGEYLDGWITGTLQCYSSLSYELETSDALEEYNLVKMFWLMR